MSHLSGFRAALLEKGFDAAVISDETNQRYLSGFGFSDGLVLVTRGESYLLTDFRYAEAAKEEACRELRVLCPEHGMLIEVASLLSENGCRKVATEEASLSCAAFSRYREKLSDFSLSGGASGILTGLRMIKDEKELETMARAQAVTDAAFAHILGWIQPGMTEIEVALELEFYMRKMGADGIAFDTIAVSGTASSRPHGVPRRVKLEKGFLTMDFGAKVDGYCSDMTRTVVLGKADADMKKLYNTVLSAQKAALAVAAEGFSCRELDLCARRVIDEAGYRGCFGHSLGHGVGMFIHEAPRASSSADPADVLKRGHVVTVEPGIYLEGRYGCRIEDMIAVCPDGSIRDFTHSPKDLIELF